MKENEGKERQHKINARATHKLVQNSEGEAIAPGREVLSYQRLHVNNVVCVAQTTANV